MDIWYGRPGALTALPWPAPGVPFGIEPMISERRSLGGARLVSRTGQPRRTWRYTWQRLTQDEYDLIVPYWDGTAGRGPFALIQPAGGPRNLLTFDQSTCGEQTATAGGFQLDTAGNVTSQQAAAMVGIRGLQWAPANVGQFLRTFNRWWPTSVSGSSLLPVLAGEPMTASLYARLDTGGPLGLRVRLVYFDATRTPALSVESAYAPLGAVWQRITVTATAPPGAAYAAILVDLDPASTLPATVHLDAWQFEYGPAATAWTPGTGTRPVGLLDFTATSPWLGEYDCVALFGEVG